MPGTSLLQWNIEQSRCNLNSTYSINIHAILYQLLANTAMKYSTNDDVHLLRVFAFQMRILIEFSFCLGEGKNCLAALVVLIDRFYGIS